MAIDNPGTHSVHSSKGKLIMPRVSRSAFAPTTSELVSVSDSESSSDSSAHYGTGDEGSAIHSENSDSIRSTPAPEPDSYGLPAPVKAIVGTFCAATAVAGGIMLIYSGNALNHPFVPVESGDGFHRALFAAGGAMLGIGSLVTMLCLLKRRETSGQLLVIPA
jgi:hypothetical protein